MINQINMSVKGGNAVNVTGADENGFAAPVATLDVTGDGFFDTVTLDLTPSVTRGLGGQAGEGAFGIPEAPPDDRWYHDRVLRRWEWRA